MGVAPTGERKGEGEVRADEGEGVQKEEVGVVSTGRTKLGVDDFAKGVSVRGDLSFFEGLDAAATAATGEA